MIVMEKLTDQEITKYLSDTEGWKLVDEKWIEKKYLFKNYLTGIDFVQKVASLSEEKNHHPFISIDYKVVRIKLSSWQANGLTELDFNLALEYDGFYEKG
jgi:4a-hydroxytetrahydrobiopterin dehydratase